MYDSDEFTIKSNQPYFVLETDNFTQHLQDSKGISQFFEFNGNKNSDRLIDLIADSCTNIIFSYDSSNPSNYKACVIGSNFQKLAFNVEKNKIYFGIRFQPGENPCFMANNVRNYQEKQINLQDFPDMDDIFQQMKDQKSFSTRIETFTNKYNFLYQNETNVKHKLFRQFIRLIVSKKGILKISELVTLTGYSARYINQIFEDISGMSAKQFCNNVKLQQVLDDMNNQNIKTISQFVTEYKFYDTAHFIHEFKAFTGKTPGEYIAFIHENDYQSHLKIV